jgi:hypothetical protein
MNANIKNQSNDLKISLYIEKDNSLTQILINL